MLCVLMNVDKSNTTCRYYDLLTVIVHNSAHLQPNHHVQVV